MPIVDDILLGLQIQIDSLWYNLLFSLAGVQWSLQRAFLMMGYTIELINQWLIDNAFTPLIQQTNASLQLAISLSFVVALLVLGVTYLLAAFARLRVVEPKTAIAWYVAGALFFAFGPQLYQGMVDFRRDLSQAFYGSTLSGLQGTTGTAFDSLNAVDSADMGLINLCDNFGSYMPVWNATIDGIDVALAYLRADGIDLMGYPSTPRDPGCQPHPPDPMTGLWTAGTVPWEWRRPGSFFANDRDPVFFPHMTDTERAASIGMASASHGRLITAWPLILFGVTEQLVYLLLTIAQGLTFISFGVAILFAFFRKTEVIARSIVDLWIELIIQTVVIALVQALVVTFFLAGTSSGNAVVVLGIGLICLIFMVIVLWSGVKAVWNTMNRLFSAFWQATGGAVINPGTATVISAAGAVGAVGLAAGAAGLASSIVGSAASVGSSALAGSTALQQGATMAQAAGVTFGGIEPLTGASRILAHLPGLRGTALGDAAEQFTEGAVTRRVARDVPLIGGIAGPLVAASLLTDRDPDHAEYDEQGRLLGRPMLVPAIGAGLHSWTTPSGKRKRASAPGDEADSWTVSDEGELIPDVLRGRYVRTGIFTPGPSVSAEEAGTRERQTYADDMRGEEMEEHIADVTRSAAGRRDGAAPVERVDGAAARMERSADALERAAATLTGSLRVSGSADVAGVMGDVMRLLGERATGGVDHWAAGELMARALGVAPLPDGRPPVRDNLARFGLFLDSAGRMGLSPELTERVGREVKDSPDRRLSAETRRELVEAAVVRGHSGNDAERQVIRLEAAARLLPNEIVAVGTIPASIASRQPAEAPESETSTAQASNALTGRQSVIGGTS